MPLVLAVLHATLLPQEYLVVRAREAAARGHEWQAKTWMLTAKSLFPDNFGIQFEAYTTEKEGGNAKESAAFFQDLFAKFPGERSIIAEIAAVVEVLKAVDQEGEEETEQGAKFYASMFHHVSDTTQRKMILQAAEKAKDPLEHCRLMLILLRRFPDRAPQHGERLVESLNTAERHELGANPPPLNMFRRMLVVEVLPCVLASATKLGSKLVLRNLLKTQEFVVAFVNKKSSVQNMEIKCDPWSLLYTVLLLLLLMVSHR